MKADYSRAESWFSPDGLLAKRLADYELRPTQAEMSQIIQDVIEHEGSIAVMEAPTGTGKTLSYLIPAAISERRIVISTATKNLQDQILNKEIPLLKGLKIPISAELAKGRENYVCLYRLARLKLNPDVASLYSAKRLKRVFEWAKTSKTGDRSELDALPEDSPIWSEIVSKGHRCLGTKCAYYGECFITKLKQRLAKARIIVVNHHLFFSDLSLRTEGIAQILPSYEAVIFDEALTLDKVATEHFGREVNSFRFAELVRDARRTLFPKNMPVAPDTKGIARTIEALESIGAKFFTTVQESVDADQKATLSHELRDVLNPLVAELTVLLNSLAESLSKRMNSLALLEAEVRSLIRRSGEIASDLNRIFEPSSGEVSWIAGFKRGSAVGSYPIEVADIIRDKLFKYPISYVFTSATLSVGDDLSYFMERIGIDTDKAVMRVYPTCFDLPKQAALYISQDLPEPNRFNESRDYFALVCKRIEKLLELSDGRAFVLFTSHRNLNRFTEALAPNLKYRVLAQGEAPRERLIQKFRKDTNSVLFGTQSFWSGVDVAGESLSCVIIDKLPFAPPDDPLVCARAEKLKRDGRDPFWEFQIPEVVLLLKQGLGRLLRSRTDRGILAILDSRLAKRRYGRAILESLPPYPVVLDLSELTEVAEKLFQNGFD